MKKLLLQFGIAFMSTSIAASASRAKNINEAKYPISCMSTGRVSLKLPSSDEIVTFDAGAVIEGNKAPSAFGLEHDVLGVETIAFKSCRGNLLKKIEEFERAHTIKFNCTQNLLCHQQVAFGNFPSQIPVRRTEDISYSANPGPLMDEQCLRTAQEIGLMVCTDADGDTIYNHKYVE